MRAFPRSTVVAGRFPRESWSPKGDASPGLRTGEWDGGRKIWVRSLGGGQIWVMWRKFWVSLGEMEGVEKIRDECIDFLPRLVG